MLDIPEMTSYARSRRKSFIGHLILGRDHFPLPNRLDMSQREGCHKTMSVAAPALLPRIRDMMVIHGEEAANLARHGGFLRRAVTGKLKVTVEIYFDEQGRQCTNVRVLNHGKLRCNFTAVDTNTELTFTAPKWAAGDWQHKIYKLFRIPRDFPPS